MIRRHPRTEHSECLLAQTGVLGAAQALAIHGDHLPLCQRVDCLDPAYEALLALLPIWTRKDIPKGVVGRNATGQFQGFAQLSFLSFTELLDVRPAICSADYRQDGDGHDTNELMLQCMIGPWVGQFGVLGFQHRAWLTFLLPSEISVSTPLYSISTPVSDVYALQCLTSRGGLSYDEERLEDVTSVTVLDGPWATPVTIRHGLPGPHEPLSASLPKGRGSGESFITVTKKGGQHRLLDWWSP